jgi:hypothetical protein
MKNEEIRKQYNQQISEGISKLKADIKRQNRSPNMSDAKKAVTTQVLAVELRINKNTTSSVLIVFLNRVNPYLFSIRTIFKMLLTTVFY